MLCDAVEITRLAGRDIWELGCAAADLSLALADVGAYVLVVDQSHAMAQASACQGSAIRSLRANALALPLPDNAFDATIAASLLNVLQQPAALSIEGNSARYAAWGALGAPISRKRIFGGAGLGMVQHPGIARHRKGRLPDVASVGT